MYWMIAACNCWLYWMVSIITVLGDQWMGLPHSPKTDSDRLMKDNQVPLLSVDLWNGKGKERKVAPPGIEPRASGLSRQRSATELRHPPTATPLSVPSHPSDSPCCDCTHYPLWSALSMPLFLNCNWETFGGKLECLEEKFTHPIPNWLNFALSFDVRVFKLQLLHFPPSPVVDCGDPGPLTNGQHILFTTTYNSVAIFTCDVGYTLQGPNSRTCQSDGQWSGSVPQCIRMLNDRIDALLLLQFA